MQYKNSVWLSDGILIPDKFKEPSYVENDFNEFKSKIKEDYKRNRALNSGLVKLLLKKYIFDNKINIDFTLDKKGVKRILNQMYKVFGADEFQHRYAMFTRAGFFLSSFQPSSFSTASLTLPDEFIPKKQKILDEFNKNKEKNYEEALIIADKAFDKLADEVLEYFRKHHDLYPVVDLIDSGAKGGTGDIRKLLISIGLSINSSGDINDVITRSHTEGLTQTQFFNYSSQAMVSQYKKSVETATPGYLIRKLNTIMTGVVLSQTYDCGSKRTLKMRVTEDNFSSFIGRNYLVGGKLKQFTENDTDLIGKDVNFRSPLYCKAEDGICMTCYNPEYAKKMNIVPGDSIGLLASTSQANMLTSLTLKAAHTGLSLNKAKINLKEDIFQYSE